MPSIFFDMEGFYLEIIMVKYGCYIIKDDFFKKFDDPYLKGNKKESRPHYCCFPDKENDKIFWVIPMSHKIKKYEDIISKRISNNKSCDILHIIEVGGRKKRYAYSGYVPNNG